ncbi:hypothetical protein QBC40DRAFT_235299 [Triangularia verruculosa]|uniref:Uncharacterized protein n=1 Tax=Triangularia verruculosa TaxID=2587418 RepID=A0AAN7AR18_9PEZI|nr:hypothetical protein QBC40DRAFT_235299 [Triangularia verruculosa]
MSENYESYRYRRDERSRRRRRSYRRSPERQYACPDSQSPAGAPPLPSQPVDPPQPPILLSHIHPVNLEESIQGGKGVYASVSVLEPVMRIERSGTYNRGDPSARPVYRIIVSLKLQFNINRVTGELQRHNRIFDSINVRYLYRNGERHDLLPKGDDVVSDIAMRNESGISTDMTAGVAATGVGHPLPAFTVHAQHASKVTYERKLRSWRKALTYETYPQPRSDCRNSYRPPITTLLGLGFACPVPESPEASFRVSSSHVSGCSCRRHRECKHRHSRSLPYNRAAHWSGQTEAQLHLWTPEIYENMTCPVTVKREVDAELIDGILRASKRGSKNEDGLRELRRYLHFDFDVEVRLREIGWGFMGMFRSSSQPPEIRARNDSGKPLCPDRAKFCVSCCTSKIVWPKYETRDLQSEAEDQIAKYGFIRRLQSPQEYQASLEAGGAPTVSAGSSTAVGVGVGIGAGVAPPPRPTPQAQPLRQVAQTPAGNSRGRPPPQPQEEDTFSSFPSSNNDQSNSPSSNRRVMFSLDYMDPKRIYHRRHERDDEEKHQECESSSGGSHTSGNMTCTSTEGASCRSKPPARRGRRRSKLSSTARAINDRNLLAEEPRRPVDTQTQERAKKEIHLVLGREDSKQTESTHRIVGLKLGTRRGENYRETMSILGSSSSLCEKSSSGVGKESNTSSVMMESRERLLASIMSEASGYGSLFALSDYGSSEEEEEVSSGWVTVDARIF